MKKLLLFLSFLLTVNLFADSFNVKVDSSTPLYRDVYVEQSVDTYVTRNIQVPYDCSTRGNDFDQIGGSILGMVIGGAIGHQFGGGSGKDLATFAGAVTGASMAESSRKKTCYRIKQVRELKTTYTDPIVQKKRVGYRNCGRLNGEEICVNSVNKMRYITITY
ncbi:MAG: hypothetical protein U9Q66_01570 [Patescibacteria group bacterium]|nr:hypothetical protein [Patescibacteria group bacterium]